MNWEQNFVKAAISLYGGKFSCLTKNVNILKYSQKLKYCNGHQSLFTN